MTRQQASDASTVQPRYAGWRSLWDYVSLVKPRVSSLLIYSGLIGLVTASSTPPSIGLLVASTLAISLVVFGAEAISAYTDREVDAKMMRTRRRPVPAGRIPPRRALLLGSVLFTMGVALALQLGVQPVLFALLGLLFYVVIYSMLLKRRTYWNIVLGSPAGAMPLLMGYSVAKPVDPTALYLAGLIILWTPPHIWALAMRLRDDYEAAGIPMLPLVLGERKSAKWIAVLSLILVGYTLLPIPLGYAGVLYAVMALLSSGLLCPVAMRLALSPNQRVAWQVFKASSPFLFLALTGVVFERMVGQGG